MGSDPEEGSFCWSGLQRGSLCLAHCCMMSTLIWSLWFLLNFCLSEERLLLKRLESLTFQAMQTQGHRLFEPALVSLVTKNKAPTVFVCTANFDWHMTLPILTNLKARLLKREGKTIRPEKKRMRKPTMKLLKMTMMKRRKKEKNQRRKKRKRKMKMRPLMNVKKMRRQK